MQFEYGLIHVRMNAKIDVKILIRKFGSYIIASWATYYHFIKNEKATINALQVN